MTVTLQTPAGEPGPTGSWYGSSAADAAARLNVDPALGLTAARAAEGLQHDGPNALPAEATVPRWRRFADQFRTYMQMILLGAAVVSAVVQEWGTAVVLVAITVLNAVVGLRQEGKAESAMNALRSMVKPTARVCRDGADAEVQAEAVVVGD